MAIAGDALRPAVIAAIIDAVFDQIEPENVEERVTRLRKELRTVDTKIQHLTAAVEQGGAGIPSIVALLAERQKERDALVAEIGGAEAIHRVQVNRVAIEAKVHGAVADWRALLTGSIADGRQLLREVLEAPMRFTPEGKVYRFRAAVATGQLVAGAVGRELVASPGGCAYAGAPETFIEGDFAA